MKGFAVKNILKAKEIIARSALHKEEGLDGILVTIGLCIIALLLCVVMRDSLTEFIKTIVGEMTTSAKNILSTPGAFIFSPMYI